MARTEHLTGKVIGAEPLPVSGETWILDDGVTGLRVRISAAGRRTWYYYRSHGGRPIKRAIGDWPTWSVAAARREAERLAGEFGGGGPPVADRSEQRQAGTLLGAVWRAYLEDGASRHRKAIAIAKDRSLWGLSWGDSEGIPVGLVDRARVMVVFRRIGKDHPVQANHAVRLLRRVWRFGQAEDLVPGGDPPTKGITLHTERPRGRFLHPDEASRFMAALVAVETPPYLRDFVELALATGARKDSILQMRWDDVHGEVWTVRGETTKTGEALTLPLLPLAVAALGRRRESVPDRCPWVFPGRGKNGHMLDPKRAWVALRSRAGVPDLHVHDLRRTLGSYMSMEGESLTIVGRALGHKDAKSTQVYAQVRTAPVRAAMGRGLDAFLAAGAGAPPDRLAAVKAEVSALSADDRRELTRWMAETEAPRREE